MNETAPETALRATQTGEAVSVAALASAIHDISYAGKQVTPGHAKVLANVVLRGLREAGWVDPEEAARLREEVAIAQNLRQSAHAEQVKAEAETLAALTAVNAARLVLREWAASPEAFQIHGSLARSVSALRRAVDALNTQEQL